MPDMDIKFSQLPIWYRLTWVFGASVFMILAYLFFVFFSLEFISSGPDVGCMEREALITDTPFAELEKGQSYSVKNALFDRQVFADSPKRALDFYFYKQEELHIVNSSRFGRYINNCRGLTSVIGELHPRDFSYSDFLNRFFPEYVVGEDWKIFELIMLEGK